MSTRSCIRLPLRRRAANVAWTLAACGAASATLACGLLAGVDWDRVVVSGDGSSGAGGSSGTSGTSGGSSGTSGTSGTSGSDGGEPDAGEDSGTCAPGTVSQGQVCMPDATWAPKCDSNTCGGFGRCMTEPKHALFNRCVPPAGSVDTSCSSAKWVSERSTPDPGGPLIWSGQLVRNNDCATTQRGYALTFSYFDAERDVVTDPEFGGIVVQAHFGFNNPPMNITGIAVVRPNNTAGLATMFPCVNADPLPSNIAVLVDAVGHRSNPLCLTIAP